MFIMGSRLRCMYVYMSFSALQFLVLLPLSFIDGSLTSLAYPPLLRRHILIYMVDL